MTLSVEAALLILLFLLLLTTSVVAISWRDALKRRGVYIALAASGVVIAVSSLVFESQSSRSTATAPWAPWTARMTDRVESCTEQRDPTACLAAALRAEPPPHAVDGETGLASSQLLHEFQMGQALLQSPRISDLLWEEFGIDREDFLGIGLSINNRSEDSHTREREYFVSNLCADKINLDRCPTEEPNIWTWRLPSAAARVQLGRPLLELIDGQPPLDNVEQWRTLRTNELAPTGLYIRIAHFPGQFYAGTVGRPEAKLVFFTEFPERSTTLRDFMAQTGSESLAETINENETLFIWVYAPTETQEPMLATWGSLFDYLHASSGIDR
jgi:hypothetical protein